MKNKDSFLNFLKTKTISESIVDEAIMQQSFTGNKQDEILVPDPKVKFNEQVDKLTNGRWVGISPRMIIGLMRFSPNWQDAIDNCSYETANLDDFTIDDLTIRYNIKVKDIEDENSGYEIKIQFPGKKQGFLMPILKKNFPNIKLAFGGGNLTGNIADEKTALNVFNAIMTVKQFQPKDKKDRPAVDNIIDSIDQLPKEWIEEYNNSVTKKADDGNQAQKKHILIGSIFDLFKANEDQIIKEPIEDFEKNVKWNANTNLITLDMLNLVDKFTKFKVKGNTPQEICKTIKSKNFGIIYRTYLKNVENEIDNKIQDKKIEKNERNSEITKKINTDTLTDILRAGKAVLIKGGKRKVEKPEPKTSAAKRRMKLFEDAEFYGAQIVTNSKWIAAINRDFDQAHCFGRGKPKVKPGTNDIDPELNLRDDELEKLCGGRNDRFKSLKQRRDSDKVEWYKDGIGYDDQKFEGGWCVAGGWENGSGTREWGPGLPTTKQGNWNMVDSYFRCKKPGERMPFITYMDCSTGRLFCSNMQYDTYGNENWYQYDFNTERNGVNDGGINKKLQNDPLFKDIYEIATDLSFEAYDAAGKHWNAITDPPPKKSDENSTLGDLLNQLEVTDNGIIILKNKSQIGKYSKLITSDLVSSVKLDFTDGNSAFSGLNIKNLSKIDCSRLTDMQSMFEGTTVNQNLDLVNTSNSKSFYKTFRDTKNAQWIVGLDTQNALDISYMFYQTQTHFQRKLVIPSLDLAKCEQADYAFFESPIEKLDFRNTDLIESASNIIVGCYLLAEFPSLRFKRLKDTGYSAFEVNNAEEIFEGCDTLASNIEKFNQTIKQLDEFYVRKLDLTEDSGIPIARCKNDIDYFYVHKNEYKNGISLQPQDGNATEWFHGKEISLDIIDLRGVTIADYLFYSSNIHRIGKIVNVDKIQSAKYMFYKTNIRSLPRIDLESASSIDGIFWYCQKIKVIKSGNEWLTKFNPQIVQAKGVNTFEQMNKLIFGEASQVIKDRFGPSLEEYLTPLAKECANNVIKKWVKDHITEETKYLMVSSQKDMLQYLDYKQKNKDIIPEINGYLLMPGASNNRVFSSMTIDFENKPIDFQNAEDITQLFFNSKIHNFGDFQNADNIIIANYAFKDSQITGNVPKISFSKLKIANEMFRSCECLNGNGFEFAEMPELVEADSMFRDAAVCKSINITKLNLEKLEKSSQMFMQCTSTIEFDDVTEFKHLTAASNMFTNCKIIDSVGTIIFDESVDASNMFGLIIDGLKSVNAIHCKKQSKLTAMFAYSDNLEIVGEFNVEDQSDMESCFKSCKKLSLIPIVKIDKRSNTKFMFKDCPIGEIYGEDCEYLKVFLNEK